MSRLSVVIFGATGFTGKCAALEMARLVRKRPELTWGVAGRSQAKLEDVMRHVAETTGDDQSHVKIIIADVKDEESLVEMCRQTQVVVNVCGPYWLYGEPVVRAAVQARAHHVDVTAEPQFIETMQLKYNDQAREAGVYIVSACGYDAVPNDMGVVFMQQNFGGTLNSVESYIISSVPPNLEEEVRARGSFNAATWESLIYLLQHWSELKPLRQKLYPTKMPTFEPELKPQRIIHQKKDKWCVPFPGPDNSIVYRTQRHLYEEKKQRPVQFRAYFAFDTFLQAVMVTIGALFIAIMCKFSYTANILLKYPRFFSGGLISKEGPTKAVMENTTFHMDLYGEGWAEGSDVTGPTNKTVFARVSGKNPGYGFAVTALLLCALTILEERSKMPQPGGVLTTGVAFKDTDLIKKLNENGATFEIFETKNK